MIDRFIIVIESKKLNIRTCYYDADGAIRSEKKLKEI